MKERIRLQDFDALWAEQVRLHPSDRMTDDQAEQDFWKKFMAKKNGYAPDGSSRLVLDRLLPLWRERGIQTALEFGPGWGNYTLDLAKLCKEVTCVDISNDVLEFILNIGNENGFHNIRTVHEKWENFQTPHCYDLVFGYNCFYRQCSLRDCFLKMNALAGKMCVAGMNTGLAPAWFHDMEEAGARIRWEWKDYLYFVGVLYQMGIDANVMIVPFHKELVYDDLDSAIDGEQGRITEGSLTREMTGDILLKHFKREEDGKLHASTSFRGGIVWWEPTSC